MATNTRSKDYRLILEFDAPKVSAGNFLRVARAFFHFLSSVADDVAGTKDSLKWLVTLEQGSLRVGAEPEPLNADWEVVDPAIDAIRCGIDMIETSEKRPPHFGDEALERVSELASVISPKPKEGEINRINIWVQNRAHEVSHKTVANVKRILGEHRSFDGSVEGKLCVVSGRKGLEFSVDDMITGHAVRCHVKKEMQEKVLAAFDSRVVVSGLVKYRRDGLPTSIEVEDLRVLGGSEDLPSFEDVKGILGSD